VKPIITFIRKLLRKKKSKQLAVDSTHIITRNHHQVSKTEISPNALSVLNRLNSAGFQAYLVGGSVRDLLLRHSPKDFDVATNATPPQIKRLFRNARIIGRRFKLAHILFHREIIEVATFRGHENIDNDTLHKTNEQGMLIRDNVYGTLEEDAWRRDFTINSLYYDVPSASIVDYTHGFSDINHRLIRMIGDPSARYHEDPVRMLRAIRFAAKLSFDIEAETAQCIRPLSGLIRQVASSRLFEEAVKLYQCGAAQRVQPLLEHHGLFEQLFPQTHALKNTNVPVSELLLLALENTDTRIREDKPVTPAFLFAILLWFPLLDRAASLQREEHVEPLPALEQAMSNIITEQNKVIMIPKRHSLVMREIWILQFRFEKRTGTRAHQLLSHPRFRAAYDLLALRALAGDAPMELADWWTTFQEVDDHTQALMIKTISKTPSQASKPKRRKKKPNAEPV
jgi:poly(A) polymerase